ncbi:exosome complex protein LRP1, partial [Phenoliferia sp. Uapishka_3]
MSADPSTALTELSTSFTVLESALAPLLSTSLEELLAQNETEPLQKAKLQVMISYVIHDLIWIYLRTSGVEPSTHPVMQELVRAARHLLRRLHSPDLQLVSCLQTRLKPYFDKLQSAEEGTTDTSREGPRFHLDKAAASRFINAAISSQKASVDPFYTAPPSGHTQNAEAGSSTAVHTRFDDAAGKLLESSDDDEEGDDSMAVEGAQVGNADDVEMGLGETPIGDAPKEVSAKKAAPGRVRGKAGRQKFDPFAGYDSPKPTPPKSKGGKKEEVKRPVDELSKKQRKKAWTKKSQDEEAAKGASASA